MSAPLVKGLIIGTSILLAAGLAIYESEQFRSWFDAQRRRIVVTLESLAQNGASPETQRRRAQEMETELREEVVKRHRMDIINRARDEGVAVDLDELDAVESIYDAQQALLDEAAKIKRDREQAERGLARRQTASSFDELVGHDGRLRQEHLSSGAATGSAQENSSGLRQRGVSSGFARGAAFGANPFDDESAMLYDQELIGAGGEELAALSEQRPRSRASTIRNITVQDGSSAQHERTAGESPYKSDAELEAEIQEAIRRSLEHEPAPEKPLIIVDDSPSATTESQQMFQMPSSASSSALLHDPNQHQNHEPAVSSARSASPMQGSIYESYYYGGRPTTTHQTVLPSTPPAQVHHNLMAPSSTTSFHSALSHKLSALPVTSTSHTNTAPSSTLSPTISAVDADRDLDSDWNSDDALTPAGTLTPTDDTLSLASDDMSVVSPLRSRTMSLAAQSEAGESVAMSDFSDIGDGIHTPASWTDVESVSGEEDFEGSQQQRQQQQRRRVINVQ